MFENLTGKLTSVLQRLTSKGRLTEKDIDEALSLVRRSLLEADVNFRVARDFVAAVKERAMGAGVMESLTPGQQVVKVVHEELTSLLSGGNHRMTPSSQPPSVVMLVGLQGSGKTTTAAKLALNLRRHPGQIDRAPHRHGAGFAAGQIGLMQTVAPGRIHGRVQPLRQRRAGGGGIRQ